MSFFLITSKETGKTYKRTKLKKSYRNIQEGQIQKVYEVKRNYGFISNHKVYKTNKEN